MTILESARVSASTISKQSFANVYNLLNNRTNVPDPVDESGKRKFVHTRPPNIGRSFRGFPFITVSRSAPSKLTNTASLSQTYYSFDFTVRVVCQDESADGLADPSGASQCEDITDNIIETLNKVANRKTLIFQGMAGLEFDMDTDQEEFNGKRVFISEFDLRFENNLTVTS